jgi:predicted metal-dependent phosphoesterase TrpH
MRVDLHLHTTASDGKLSPAEIVRKAAGLGLNAIAITDHDSVEGVEPAFAAAEDFPGLLVIPGVELSADIPGGEVHILGYFIDHHHQGLKRSLESLRNSRRERGRKIVAKLAQLNIDVDWQRVLELAAGASVGRPHIAEAMMERGYISSLREAFTKYIGRNGPAYVERERLTPLQAVELVLSAGGLPTLAHPANIEGLESLIPQLKQFGLVGLESYYNGYPKQTISWLNGLAHDHGLIPCGGSDYHGAKAGIGSELGSVNVPPECVAQLVALAEQRQVLSRQSGFN